MSEKHRSEVLEPEVPESGVLEPGARGPGGWLGAASAIAGRPWRDGAPVIA
ncbi:hypothetical protein [Camelimonas lactis]|uniref:hypothetical protein n=1 Tax=Camelimonas lactis TaxID=659006 RepID=UPI001404E9D9|nr:hypothetical protein [Camelimonas lactis]